MATTPTEKLLVNLLNSSKRIEELLDKKKPADKDDGTISTEVIGGMSSDLKSISNSLKNIEGESKKTNELLRDLIDVSTYSKKEVNAELKDTAKAMSKLGGGVNRMVNAVQILGKVPDAAIDKFKSMIMLSAFLDPKTGDPLATQQDFDNAASASNMILKIVGGVALVGITMVGFSFVLPQIATGLGGFVMVLAGLTLALVTTSRALHWGSGGFNDTSPLKAINSLVIGIAGIGTAMILFGMTLPLVAKGALGFVMVLAGLTLGIVTMSKALQWGSGGFKDTSPINTLKVLLMSITLTGAIMLGFSFILPQLAIGALGFITVIGAITLSIFLMNKVLGKSEIGGMSGLLGGKKNLAASDPSKQKGKGPLHTLSKLLFSIVISAAVLIGVGFFAQQAAAGALVMVLSIGALTGVAMLAGTERVEKGAKNLILLGGALAIFAGSLAVYAQLAAGKLSWNDLAILGATIAGVSLIATVLGIPPIAGFAESGSKALIAISGALTIFASGLGIYAQLAAPNLTWENIGMLGAVIGGVSLIATILGIPPIAGFAIAGSVALIAIGGALGIFSLGLIAFTKSGFTGDHIVPLTGSITAVGLVATGLGFFFPLAMLGSVALGAIGLALLPFTKGLSIFAESGYKENDNERLKSAFTGVVDAIDSVGFIKMARVGTKAMLFRNVGETLTGLAKGIQSFANLTFDTYELNEETGEMKLKERVRLKPADITKTGIAIGMVLESLVDPIIKFGGAMSGSGGGGLFSWGKNDVERGIDSFGVIGSGLVNLATGVQDWANMTITEYGIQTNNETGLNEIVPIKKRPIKSSELVTATAHIAAVLTALVNPLVEFGKAMGSDEGSGLFGFGKSDVERGMDGFGTVSDGLSNLADGINAWARMEYFEMEVVEDPNTGLNVLQPKKQAAKPIDVTGATTNIIKVLDALPQPLINFGKKLAEGWGDPAILAIENLGEMSSGLGSLAEVVNNWSHMSYTKMKVDKETGELVPDEVVEINDMSTARKNIVSTLTTITSPIIAVSKIIDKNGGVFSFNNTVTSLIKVNQSLGKIAKDVQNIWSDDKIVSSGKNYKTWIENITSGNITILNRELNKFKNILGHLDLSFMNFMSGDKKDNYFKFVDSIKELSWTSSKFEKFVNSFDRMAISMGTFAENFNMMDTKGIEAFGIWTNTLLQAIEVGEDAAGGMFDSFLDAASSTVDSAFSFGKNLLGAGEDPMSPEEKQSMIDQTVSKETDDPSGQKFDALNSTLQSLMAEITSLKATMSGTLDVNISGIDGSAARKIND